MLETPHSAILDRDEARAVVEKHYSKQTALLRDLANYGSNLVIRAFESSPKGMAEVVVCGVLLKQVVAMVDAAEVLLSSGCGHASFLPARTAFEASLYLDYILDSDCEHRATRFIVANYRDERVWASRAIPGTPEEVAFTAISESLGVDVHSDRPTLATDAAAHLAEVNRILAQPNLAAVDKEFDTARQARRPDVKWYALDNDVKSIRQIADQVGRLPEYEFFYSKGSLVAHTGTYKDHIRFAAKEARLKPIRHVADINVLLNFIVSICIRTFKRVLERYRPGETLAFTRKYLDDWRDPFVNVTNVSYKF